MSKTKQGCIFVLKELHEDPVALAKNIVYSGKFTQTFFLAETKLSKLSTLIFSVDCFKTMYLQFFWNKSISYWVMRNYMMFSIIFLKYLVLSLFIYSHLSTYLSPCIRCEPHFEQEKHFMWKTLICGGAPVRMTNSLAGMACPHAAHAPPDPNILEQRICHLLTEISFLSCELHGIHTLQAEIALLPVTWFWWNDY